MRVIVCGGRDYQDRDRVFEALDRLHKKRGITCVIHGACKTGADRWADEWAKERDIEVERYEADWIRLGFWAGPSRNQEMRDKARADGVVAFPSNGTGTADMCRRAQDPIYGPPLNVWYPCGAPDTN